MLGVLVRTKDPGDFGEASLFSLKQRENPFNNIPRGQCLPPRDPVGMTVRIQSQAGYLCLRDAPRAGEAGKGKDARLDFCLLPSCDWANYLPYGVQVFSVSS